MNNPIKSVSDYIKITRNDSLKWEFSNYDSSGCPWFRGHNDEKWELIPSVFREYNKFEGEYDEFQLTKTFRNRSSTFGVTPGRKASLDEWLCLMQHFKLPTRLLDWTESALVALFFAVFEADYKGNDKNPAVWMLHPIELNKNTAYIKIKDCKNENRKMYPIQLALDKGYEINDKDEGKILLEKCSICLNSGQKYKVIEGGRVQRKIPIIYNSDKKSIEVEGFGVEGPFILNHFLNTWTEGKIAIDNFTMAFYRKNEIDRLSPSIYPIAVQANYNNVRLSVQKSCFTIHGIDERPINMIFDENSNLAKQGYLKKYIIDKDEVRNIIIELRRLGITYSNIYPDFDGLAIDLKERFFKRKNNKI